MRKLLFIITLASSVNLFATTANNIKHSNKTQNNVTNIQRISDNDPIGEGHDILKRKL